MGKGSRKTIVHFFSKYHTRIWGSRIPFFVDSLEKINKTTHSSNTTHAHRHNPTNAHESGEPLQAGFLAGCENYMLNGEQHDHMCQREQNWYVDEPQCLQTRARNEQNVVG